MGAGPAPGRTLGASSGHQRKDVSDGREDVRAPFSRLGEGPCKASHRVCVSQCSTFVGTRVIHPRHFQLSHRSLFDSQLLSRAASCGRDTAMNTPTTNRSRNTPELELSPMSRKVQVQAYRVCSTLLPFVVRGPLSAIEVLPHSRQASKTKLFACVRFES